MCRTVKSPHVVSGGVCGLPEESAQDGQVDEDGVPMWMYELPAEQRDQHIETFRDLQARQASLANKLDEIIELQLRASDGGEAPTDQITGLALMSEAAHAWSRGDLDRSLELSESSRDYWRTDVPIHVIPDDSGPEGSD